MFNKKIIEWVDQNRSSDTDWIVLVALGVIAGLAMVSAFFIGQIAR